MDPALTPLTETARTVEHHPATIPVISCTTGQPLTTDIDWAAHARNTVNFARTINYLNENGTTTYLEIGPDTHLTPHITAPLVLGALKTKKPETTNLHTTLATLHTRTEHNVTWPGPTRRHTPLPTYPFQHTTYWPTGSARATDATDLGLEPTTHPHLAGAITLPGNTTVYTGRITPRTHPWLTQHTILGTPIAPATTLLDLILHTAGSLGCEHIDRFDIDTPLAWPDGAAVRVQVTLEPPDGAGRRDVSIHTVAEGTNRSVLNAHAVVSPGVPPRTRSWVVPAGATPLELDGLHARLAGLGYEYGPVFQGLTAAWEHGGDIYAEVALPDVEHGFTVHPALLDAALRPVVPAGTAAGVPFPVSWTGVAFTGHRASVLRARFSPVEHGYAVLVGDADGRPVMSAGTVEFRPIAPDRLISPATAQPLRVVQWRPLPVRTGPVEPGSVVAIGSSPVTGLPAVSGIDDLDPAELPQAVVYSAPAPTGGDDLPVAARTVAERAVTFVRRWLADDRLSDVRLVVLTRDATTGALEPASAWGELCAVQAEHPGRVVLADLDSGTVLTQELIAAVLAGGHAQYALREGVLHTAHLVPLSAGPATGWDPGGTVLVTGERDGVGGLVADHLTQHHGVRHVLVSGTGPEALADVVDRHPVTAVIHTAEGADETAWLLHRLTRDRPLVAFVLFSAFTGPAATTFADALAAHRHAEGLPGTAVAWGPRAGATAVARRVAHGGEQAWQIPMSAAAALSFLDQALVEPHPRLVAAHLAGGAAPVQRAEPVRPRLDLRRTLGEQSPEEVRNSVLDFVRQAVADVLGYTGAESISAHQQFQELGISSLTATELRDRLATGTGVPLPATLVYDYPTPETLAEYVSARIAPAAPSATQIFEEELGRLEGALADVPDADSRGSLARRLTELASRIDAERRPDEPESGDLESATDEELFAIINNDN
ncbi:phosphopantetheine-binding protein [Amycolatopsis sp. NPDC024027]|uniref:phosphopantetheine-binding protein n=1 Tax=Amycolatopsis sp. NPDC024027 TaxID=3154327 RepID=UPI00340D4241